MESHILEVCEHLFRVIEPVRRELVVTLPVHIEPSRIEVDDIAWILVLTYLIRHIVSFLLREIGYAAHPCSERPQWRHLRFAYKRSILVQDLFRFSEEDEEVEIFVSHIHLVQPYVRCTEIAGHRRRSMHEHSISAVGHEERHRLVHLVSLRSLRVCDEHMHLLSHLVERCRGFPASEDHLARRESEHRIDEAGIIPAALYERERRVFDLGQLIVIYGSCLCKHSS